MGFKAHVLVFGLLGLAFGVAELIAPDAVLHGFGVPSDASAILMTRLGCGPLNVGFGLAAALSFRVREIAAQRALLTAGLAYATTATLGSLYFGLTNGAYQLMMWSMLLITIPLGGNAARLLVALNRKSSLATADAETPPPGIG